VGAAWRVRAALRLSLRLPHQADTPFHPQRLAGSATCMQPAFSIRLPLLLGWARLFSKCLAAVLLSYRLFLPPRTWLAAFHCLMPSTAGDMRLRVPAGVRYPTCCSYLPVCYLWFAGARVRAWRVDSDVLLMPLTRVGMGRAGRTVAALLRLFHTYGACLLP